MKLLNLQLIHVTISKKQHHQTGDIDSMPVPSAGHLLLLLPNDVQIAEMDETQFPDINLMDMNGFAASWKNG